MIIHDFIASEGTGEFPFQFRSRQDNDDIVFTMTWPLGPLLTIEAGTQGTWCGADFLYNRYNGRRMKQPSHSKVLHPTPDIGHNPDCVARVLTHPGGTRWCKDGAKMVQSHTKTETETSSTNDCDFIHQRLSVSSSVR